MTNTGPMRVCKSQTKTSSLPRCCQPALGKLHGRKIYMYGKYCRPGHKKNLNIGNMFGSYDVDGRLDIGMCWRAQPRLESTALFPDLLQN